jgi:hypothetical protein
MGPMENIMNILHITSKGKMLKTLEEFHIYKETKVDNQIRVNDKCTFKCMLLSCLDVIKTFYLEY